MSNYAEIIEAVRATIATYTQALDDGRADDVVATYTDDGEFEMPGMGTFTGREQLLTGYEKWRPRRAQRHMVSNTLLTEWSGDAATAISDVVFVVKGDDGTWTVQFVARYHDKLHNIEGRWLFARRYVEQV